jgi:hypothetical protein
MKTVLRLNNEEIYEKFKPSITKYQPGEPSFLATGKFDEADGIFIEWLGAGRIVVRINGVDYRQTIEEFVNNCK